MTFKPFRGEKEFKNVATLCIGSGRFLRALLVPVVEKIGGVIIAQPRGEHFVDYLNRNNGVYEVDTVMFDGIVQITKHQVEACGSLSKTEDRDVFVHLPKSLPHLRVIGVGITEQGFSHTNDCIIVLAHLLKQIRNSSNKHHHISILNTDNVYMNGSRLNELVVKVLTDEGGAHVDEVLEWLRTNVTFHNTMVDRITAHREGDPNVPRAEPLPSNALVIEDVDSRLPHSIRFSTGLGVHISTKRGELEKFVALKLRIANATHTSMVYAMALSGLAGTSSSLTIYDEFMQLIDGIFWRDILPALTSSHPEIDHRAIKTYAEWVKRMKHPYFELGTFFICQNAIQKLNFRIVPTLTDLVVSLRREPSPLLAYSIAAMLRFLTPSEPPTHENIFTNRFVVTPEMTPHKPIEYESGLTVDFETGEYKFACAADKSLPKQLYQIRSSLVKQSSSTTSELANLLERIFSGLNNRLNNDDEERLIIWISWLQKVAAWYMTIVDDELNGLGQLDTVRKLIEAESWLQKDDIDKVVATVVDETPVIDVHTHLFPPTHGQSLFLYGIDELLTYHYLVAEYFMVAESKITPEKFQNLSKREQAELIWQELFINRSPISEACQGVLTTLKELGLSKHVETRSLDKIRKWTEQFSADEYVDMIFRIANVKYVVMTNIPYVEEEKNVWLDSSSASRTNCLTNERFKSALRLDAFLTNDSNLVGEILTKRGFEASNRGLRDYLEKWIKLMSPEYMIVN